MVVKMATQNEKKGIHMISLIVIIVMTVKLIVITVIMIVITIVITVIVIIIMRASRLPGEPRSLHARLGHFIRGPVTFGHAGV